jgi:hypothetical protein
MRTASMLPALLLFAAAAAQSASQSTAPASNSASLSSGFASLSKADQGHVCAFELKRHAYRVVDAALEATDAKLKREGFMYARDLSIDAEALAYRYDDVSDARRSQLAQWAAAQEADRVKLRRRECLVLGIAARRSLPPIEAERVHEVGNATFVSIIVEVTKSQP